LSKKATQGISIILFAVSLGVFTWNLDKIYTASSFGLFALLMLFQMLFQWKYARRFYISFIVIYIPFFFVNSALTGSYSDKPVVFYDDAENLGIRVGTMPLEDSFYCFSMLYGSVLLFEYFRIRWNYSKNMSLQLND
jgi:lycopene cyclase domain-containing protein